VTTATLTDRFAGVQASLALKAPVRVATTGNITLAGFFPIDGVTLAQGDANLRVLVKSQTDPTQNGLYDAQSQNWTRCVDLSGNSDAVNGTRIYVANGTTGRGLWVVSQTDPLIIGTTAINFLESSQVDVLNSLFLPDGTAAAPALVFNSEQTTGLYRVGAGKLGVSILGTEAFAIGATGITTASASASYSFQGVPFAQNVVGTGYAGIAGNLFIYKQYTAPFGGAGHPEAATLRVQRFSNYAGGNDIENTLWVQTDIAAGVTDSTWAILSQMNNRSTNASNSGVAAYLQGVKYDTSATWAAVCEVRDSTGPDPLGGSIGIEIDHASNGTDANGARIALDIVGYKYNAGGTAFTLTYGIRLGPQGGDPTKGTITTGLFFNSGTFGKGIDLTSPTFTVAPILAPTYAGGTAVSSSLTLQSTTGVGSSDYIRAVVGNAGATESWRVPTGGQFVKGYTAAVAIGANTPALQIHGTTTGTAALSITRWSADANAP